MPWGLRLHRWTLLLTWSLLILIHVHEGVVETLELVTFLLTVSFHNGLQEVLPVPRLDLCFLLLLLLLLLFLRLFNDLLEQQFIIHAFA